MAMTADGIEWIKMKAREKAWQAYLDASNVCDEVEAYLDASNVCDEVEEACDKALNALAKAEKARDYAWEAYKALDNPE